MIRCLFPLLLSWVLLAPAWSLPLCLELELRRETTVDRQITTGEPQRVRVVLAEDYLEFEDSDGRVVHDFVSNQSHLVSGQEYARRSLYADIGFRAAELRNRLKVIQALQESKMQAIAGEVVTAEHLLGIDDEVSEAAITKAEGRTISYSHGATVLAQFSAEGRQLTPPQSKAFVRFLRYYCSGHPDILADVRARAVLPDDIRVDVINVNEAIAFRLHVTSVESCQPTRPDFSALAPTVLPPEPIGSLAATALNMFQQAVVEAQQASLARADGALAKGDTLQAALFYFETLLMQGGEAPTQLANARALFEANEDSKLLFAALQQGHEDPQKAMAILESLEPKAGPAVHILKIFRAGMLLPLGDAVKARDLYVEALLVNPAIAGAWKDLGDIYHSNFETDMAWLCWDVGRKLAPGHGMLRDVDKLEEVLRSNYPGFF